MSALPVASALTRLRHGPAVLGGREEPLRGNQTFLDATPIPILEMNEPLRVVSGGLSQPWKVFGGEVPPLLTAAQLRDWAEPGWIKVVETFEIKRVEDQSAFSLSAELRIGMLDNATRRAFAPYWWLIKPASGRIRREVLAEVKRQAESDVADGLSTAF